MHSADAYAVLAKELETVRLLSVSDLIALIGRSPIARALDIGGEPVDLETAVTWIDAAHTSIRMTAHLRGPSTWHHQHMQEAISIPCTGRRSSLHLTVHSN